METDHRLAELDTVILLASVLFLLMWEWTQAAQRGWYPDDLALLQCVASALGALLLVASVVRIIASVMTRRTPLRPTLAILVLSTAYITSLLIPWKTSWVFDHNRAAFVELAAQAQQAYETDGRYSFPRSPLYKWALIYSRGDTSASVAEFIVGDFYLPLVFISTGRVEDAPDTCSDGGRPIERLEFNWYLCRRDWN